MSGSQIRFNDGAAYERYMGRWSRLVGEAFLDWLAPSAGQRWLDVGCGNGAFTELLAQRCAPAELHGIDPSAEQLAHARAQAALSAAQFRQGDAMALPYPDSSFDAAVMPLVIFFVPEPPRGVTEMRRVVCAGGTVAAYAWDMIGGGFPYEAVLSELRGLGVQVPAPPRPEASRIDVLRELWADAGLGGIETREIDVRRTFADFDDFWTTVLGAPSVGALLAAMTAAEVEAFKTRLRARLPVGADGRITCTARANAIKGRVTR